MKLILSFSGNPNIVTFKELYTPLHLAVINNKPEFINILLHNNADPSIKDATDKISFDWAIELSNQKIINLLIGNEDHPHHLAIDYQLDLNQPYADVDQKELLRLFSKIPDNELEMAMSGLIPYEELVAQYDKPRIEYDQELLGQYELQNELQNEFVHDFIDDPYNVQNHFAMNDEELVKGYDNLYHQL